MTSMMKELKERTEDVSEFERSMTTVQLEMKEVKVNMNKVAEALSRISEDNHTRDRKFEEVIKRINEGLHERDLKTEKIEGLESTKIEEKFADLETRISAMEKALRTQGAPTAKVRKANQDMFHLNAKQYYTDSKQKAKKKM